MSALAAAVLVSAVCFYNILPDDIKPGKHNPQKVAAVNAVASSYDSISIAWKPAANATSYRIYRSDEENGDYEECGEVDQPEFTDNDLDTGTRYWYMIRSYRGDKRSRYSERVNATPRLEDPKLSGLSTDAGAELTSKEVPGATGYVFYRDGSLYREQPMAILIDGALKEKEKHDYQVVAVRKVGNKKVYSDKSNTIEAGKITVKITLENATEIGDIFEGSKVEIAGTVKSNVTLERIEVGVMDEKGENWIDKQKYEKKDLDSKTFDLSEADKSLKFGDLKEGKYKYRILAYPKGAKTTTVTDQSFKVESNPALAAVEWAVNIANDNSFNYGSGKAAHHAGCYFCGTQKRKKGKYVSNWSAKWDKTYCCNPFVYAAYAHGAKDPATLASCQKGGCGGMRPEDWTGLGSFEYIGTCKSVPFSELKPGDIVMSNRKENGWSHHVWMYVGGNQVVEASRNGWGADSIGVRDNAEHKYNRYRNHGGTYVVRYKGPGN